MSTTTRLPWYIKDTKLNKTLAEKYSKEKFEIYKNETQPEGEIQVRTGQKSKIFQKFEGSLFYLG